jgi:hypothetical protein
VRLQDWVALHPAVGVALLGRSGITQIFALRAVCPLWNFSPSLIRLADSKLVLINVRIRIATPWFPLTGRGWWPVAGPAGCPHSLPAVSRPYACLDGSCPTPDRSTRITVYRVGVLELFA